MSHVKVQHITGSVPGFTGASGTGLLQTLVDWVTSNSGVPGLDWTAEMDQTVTDESGATISGSPFREVILSNTGLSGNEEIIIGLREYSYPSNNEYNIELNGYLAVPAGWNSHALATHGLNYYDFGREHWAGLPMLQCFDNEMEYWFYSCQEFISVAVRVGTSYYQCYLGNGMRLSSPNEHPYPLVIAGSSAGNRSYQNDGYGPARPGLITDAFGSVDLYTAFYVNSAGVFVKTPITEPMQGVSSNTSIMNTRGGSTFMCPVFWRDNQNTYMQLQNLFVVRTINMLSESSYTDSENRKYRIFAQGVTDYDYEFLAMLEDIGTTTTTIAPTTTTT